MIERFLNNDEGYQSWCKNNNTGYVFNYFGGTDKRADMNKIHHVNCPYLWRKIDEGKRTSTYEKVCSDNLDELIKFIGSERGSSWKYCKSKHCFGN